ncbi:MAG: dihydroorotase [Gammaproteobacteria bacterium]
MSAESLTLIRPDDWHIHLRDGPELSSVVGHTAARFGRAIVMPNLRPPVTTTQQALEYLTRIHGALPADSDFEPLMTLYLTDNTSPEEIARAVESGKVVGVKLYPAGATTNSDAGVTDLALCAPALAAMSELGLPLLVHGEVVDADVDIFDREHVFVKTVLAPLLAQYPDLRVVLEHITTQQAVDFVRNAGDNVAATITPQHLLCNRNALLAGGLRPHNYCLPVLKAERHRQAVLEAATDDHPRFFLGTDSAPHAKSAKENACGCAGIFSAHAGIELYAEAFEAAGQLSRLESFASFRGAEFYGLARNTKTITLVKEEWTVPDQYPFGAEHLVPFRAGETLKWRLVSEDARD